MKTIFLVEDDANLADGLILNLEAEGYQVIHLSEGHNAVSEFQRGSFDLVLLDIMLPGVDGLTICKEIREAGSTVPILFITARSETDQRIEGLVAGGDDYITKPFEIGELLARIQGIFRREAWLQSNKKVKEVFEFDGRTVDFSSYRASGPGGESELTRKECLVMKYLVERTGKAVSRDHLLDAVWGYHTYPTNRTIDNFILKLRKILEDDPKNPEYIETVRGVGYRFAGARKNRKE